MMYLVRLFVLFALLLLQSNGLFARGLKIVPYQKLFDASDLVIIATPTETKDTAQPGNLPGYPSLPVVSVITKFRISAVLKGDNSLKEVVLHHYREKHDPVDPQSIQLPAFNEVELITFSPNHGSFLLFLVRENNGHYAPFDQTDPALQSVQKLIDEIGL